MYVACTIILTIVVANILIAYTIESTEELKIEGGFILSEQMVADVIGQYESKALSWMIIKTSFELKKVNAKLKTICLNLNIFFFESSFQDWNCLETWE